MKNRKCTDNVKTKLTEEEKKQKFGDKYDPNYKPKPKGKGKEKEGNKNKTRTVEVSPLINQNRERTNDWEWYAPTEQIARDVGSFPYNTLSGVPVSLDSSTGEQQWDDTCVMTIEYVNAQYSDGNISTGLVQAANQLYQFLRHKNSGAKNYEPADVITLVLAMREIYAEFGELRRALGLARFFNLENRHLPQTLMKACGIDYEDLIANFANYRGKLNILATRINSIAVPNYFKAFERADLITNNVFMDSDSFRSQYYLYRKAGYYTWNSDGANGSELTFTARDMATTSTFGDRLEILAEMVNSVTTDTDANTIAGDVLFAFANSEIYQLAQISDDYLVVPYKDENILAQVENATFVTGYFPVNTTANDVLSRLADSMNVTQINGNLFWQPNFSATAAIARHALPTTKRLFNSHKEEPDYKDNLDWSRNIMYARITATGSSQTFFIQNCGLELCVAATIYTMNKKIAVATGLVSGDMTLYGAYVAQLLAQIEMFDWHPAVYVNLAPTGIYTCADIKKYTWLALDTIGATHDAANTAAFYSVQLFQESSR